MLFRNEAEDGEPCADSELSEGAATGIPKLLPLGILDKLKKKSNWTE